MSTSRETLEILDGTNWYIPTNWVATNEGLAGWYTYNITNEYRIPLTVVVAGDGIKMTTNMTADGNVFTIATTTPQNPWYTEPVPAWLFLLGYFTLLLLIVYGALVEKKKP